MKILIAGGSGLIGRALISQLIKPGHQIILLTRTPDKVDNLPPFVQIQAWDGKTTTGWGNLINDVDAIINLAGAGIADARWSEARKRLLISSRVEPAQAIVAAVKAATNKPKVVIQSSAVGYYGTDLTQRFTEQSPAGDDFLADLCQQWEAAAAPIAEMGVRLVIARTGVVLSLDGGAFPKQLLPFKLFAGGPVGSGEQWFPWIHINDVAAALTHLLTANTTAGPVNLTAPNPLTNAEFSRTIGKVMGRPAFMPAPAFAMRLLFGEMATILLDGQCVLPHALNNSGFTFQYADAESALKDLLA
jgi:uncharacterized protein (TIGR01777 family)